MVAAAAVALGGIVIIPWGSPVANAADRCPATQQPRLIAQTNALIEAAAVDERGRLYLGDLSSRNLFRIDIPGAAPQRVATIGSGTGVGGVAIGPDGKVYIGGSTATDLLTGDTSRTGTISIFDPQTGQIESETGGFSATSGLAVAADGTAYATNDLGTLVGTRSADGAVNPEWAEIPSANGGVISADNEWLYVSRSFIDPGVSRISLDNPNVIENVWTAPAQYSISAPDGLELDEQGRVVVPMNATGEIVRVDGEQVCTLASGLLTSTQVVYGKGDHGFSAGNLYRVGFDGRVMEIPAGKQ